jgi:hypothetical protein
MLDLLVLLGRLAWAGRLGVRVAGAAGLVAGRAMELREALWFMRCASSWVGIKKRSNKAVRDILARDTKRRFIV